MTEQEKELMEIIDYWVSKTISPNVKSQCIFDSIINRYPQITKKPVRVLCYTSRFGASIFLDHATNSEGCIEFDNPEKGKEWLNKHFVEVQS